MSQDPRQNQLTDQQQQQVRQAAWNMFENQVFAWFDTLRTEIETKQATEWSTEEQALHTASQIENSGNELDALRDATGDVQARYMRIVVRYLQQHMNPHMDADPLKDSVKAFIRELHNPDTKEVLLLAVKEEYRDHVRERFSEFAIVLWGLLDMAQGTQTDNLWRFMAMLAQQDDVDLQTLIAQLPDVTVDDLPDDVLG